MKLAVLAALAALVVVGAAAAARGPSAAEAKALRSAVKGYIAMPRSPAAKDDTITRIRVSSVDRRFAGVRLDSKSAGPSELVLHQTFGTWWVLEFGSSLGCDTAPRAVLDDLGVGCSPPNGVAWIDTCGPLVSKPASLVLACADGGYELTGLVWHNWGKANATATGKAVANDCTPNCAAGHFHSYRATVTASRLKRCGAAPTYMRLVIAYPGRRPTGLPKRDEHALTC